VKYRRSTAEILLDILKAVDMDYRTITRIMYASNVSWVTIVRNLQILMDRELIEMVENPRKSKRTPKIYKITIKGQQLLKETRRSFDLVEELFREE